ncbi:MAG TPA: Asp-tRNA(Asn)/Glu-tRNA(Gln) amidotransferase subunit GatC [bacterium]|nr:Asp-tRNA(Asn)/Glu-tRNA(Gln) amidotransferase subunit GatC [bacterium]
MADRLTTEDVARIARLAAMQLTAAEVKKFQGWLTEAIDYIEVLQELDTAGVIVTSQVTGLVNLWRQDQTQSSLTQKQALQNAPATYKGYFKVEAVFDRSEG